MALKPLKREEISKESLQALTQSLKDQKIGGSFTPVWNNEINVFRAKDYENDFALVYVPNMPEMYEGDNRVKYHERVHSHQLRKLGTDTFAGTLRNTKDLVDESLGLSGESPLDLYVQKAFTYYDALKSYELARKYRATSIEELSEDDAKAFRSEIFRKFPIRTADTSYWFPIFVFDMEKDAKGKSTFKPIVNAEGKFSGKMMWYRASEKMWLETLKKAYELVLPDGESNFEGLLAMFDYRLKDGDKKDASVRKMQSAGSLTVSFLTEGLPKFKPIVDATKPFMEEWDAEAQAKYTSADLMFDVKETAIYSDADLTEELEKLYGNIEEEGNKLLEMARQILDGGTKSGVSSIEGVLGGQEALETTQHRPELDITPDALSFGDFTN